MFNELIKNSFTLTLDSLTPVRRVNNTTLYYHVDIGSPSNITNPKFLIAAHQTEVGTGVPKKTKQKANFDHFDARKYLVEINGVRYPKDVVELDFNKHNYFNQYRDLKAFLFETM